GIRSTVTRPARFHPILMESLGGIGGTTTGRRPREEEEKGRIVIGLICDLLAREKEVKKLEAAKKAEAAKLQAQQASNTSKMVKRLKKESGEENPQDYVDLETPLIQSRKFAAKSNLLF
ncbi:Valine--tRNA ligase, partial [Actinidia chinensis var. chinensis]